MSLPWSRRRADRWSVLLLGTLLALGCGRDNHARARPDPDAPVDPVQAEAELLGRELADILDRVMAYKSSHQGRLPTSFRQAGIDSLTPTVIRHLDRRGSDPLVSIRFRRPGGRQIASCEATSLLLEDMLLNAGTFDIPCLMTVGGVRSFTITPPPPPPE
ncbi:MAG: hypothetical protein SGJ01_13575 [Gemmatimonadota bacterium]|nr:hypothetical protein [Gemmatimonadota bacterium]